MNLHRIPDSLNMFIPVGGKDVNFEAVVCDAIRPKRSGRIVFQGTTWKAICEQNIELLPDVLVYIVDRIGNTLVVKAMLYPLAGGKRT